MLQCWDQFACFVFCRSNFHGDACFLFYVAYDNFSCCYRCCRRLCWFETCTVCRRISLCHVAMETHPPASLGFLKSPPRGAFKLKDGGGSLRTGRRAVRAGRPGSSASSRRPCYADCRQQHPQTASRPPYHHPSATHQRHAPPSNWSCAILRNVARHTIAVAVTFCQLYSTSNVDIGGGWEGLTSH